MKYQLSCLIVCLSFIAFSLNAQIPTLQVNGKKENTEVYLQTLDIQVDVTGNVATTKFLMTFKNRTGKILEGELLFPLPYGVTVSSYALDINGKMRDAVPVEKAKATQVFEEIVQRRVDPGLLERVEGNNFRTRIYPIPANGTRTISIGYEEELSQEKGVFRYRLPMDNKEIIEKFSLNATVWQGDVKPVLEEKIADELTFDKKGNNFTASFSRNNFKTSNSLSFALPIADNIPQVAMQSASGSYYFLASCTPPDISRKKEWGNALAIIWDASLSGLQRDTKRELDLLDVLIREKKNLTISLFLLNNRYSNAGSFQIKNGDWSILRQTLETVIYDGGTDYSQINLSGNNKEYLLFSDGLSTLSDTDFVKTKNKYPVHCIVSSSKADYSSLKWIALQTGGKFINLNALSQENAQKELLNESIRFLGVEKPQSVKEIYPSITTPVSGNFSIAGILDNATATEITLLFGFGNTLDKRIKVKLNLATAAQQGNIHRIWAQKKISELDMCYEKNKDELTELGQEFGIVTRNTSLIVLETLQDYITYRITPPAELQSEYMQWRKGQDEIRQREEESLLASAIESANRLKEWWKIDFAPKKSKYPKPDGDALPPPSFEDGIVEIATVEGDLIFDHEEIQFTPPVIAADEYVSDDDIMLSQMEILDIRSEDISVANVVVAEERGGVDIADLQDHKVVVSEPKTSRIAQPVIRRTPIKQENEYSSKLTGKAEEDYAIYLELRPDYINTPTFYFDMADWFFRLNDKEKALRILTAVAELEIENASLLRLIGYRLKEYQEYNLETYICKKVIDWRPMEPQSYRDYALALADAGKNQEALNTLYSVLTQSYASNINSRSTGIDEVVVTELNQMIAKNTKLKTSNIDKQLIHAMPVDIRVVINWNMNSTDIDLHVKDPNGETCYYGHRETMIGGRISNDITQGYGPEQFMLKKAIKGKYEIYVKYFGDSQVKAEGPSTVMLEIYTNYSTKNQKREVVCLQMSKDAKREENGLVKVGEFEF